ncbi:MAG: amidohydrolase family protein [Eubacteriales bacterium]|nr:amidohydrolase family protein [Eubacteriales bacterium]
MTSTTFALKGTILYSLDARHLSITEKGCVLCENGVSAGVFPVLPEKYKGVPVYDQGENLIVPGFTDLHVHAPQYSYRGTSMDMELLEWLNTVTFPQEARYRDLDYAQKAYSIFAQDLKRSPTTRACVFATLHSEATVLLMKLLEETGLVTLVGKVNMDRNGSPLLQEESARASADDTRRWLGQVLGSCENTRPILTPRFIPSCSDELMRELSAIQRQYGLPVQSHLSENKDEIAWVKQLCPSSRFYGDAYRQFGLFGGEDCPTVMAHCVYSSEEEIALIKDRGVFVAHCPQSNTNIASGIAPVRRYLEEGLRIGLGSDVAGGCSLSLFRAMADAIQVSKLRWRLVDASQKPLTLEEAFFMATLGGGAFFGKVGSFQEGYDFDALVLTDENLPHPQPLTPKERLERLVYLSDDRNLAGKYVKGRKLL